MRRISIVLAATLTAVALCLAGCASAPKVPSWVLSTPPADSTTTYFVGSASGADLGSVSSDAVNNLIAGIMQYMGVSVKVSSSATAKASLDSYSADIRQTVETQSSNRLSGFQVKEKSIQKNKDTGNYTVHILAGYATKELEKEKSRIAALFKEKADAVAKPEAEGDSLAGGGRYFDAVGKYIEAMAAASGSDVENADIKVERNANKARSAASMLSILSLSGTQILAMAGKAPSRVLEIQTQPGASLVLTYPRKLANGKIGSKTENLNADSKGVAKFTLPSPDFVGKAKIVIRPDFSSALDLLYKLDKKYDSARNALEDTLFSKFAEIGYVVESAAKSLPMVALLADLDSSGNVAAQQIMQSGLLDALVKAGFDVRSLALDPRLVALGTDALLPAARKAASPDVVRLVYGSGRVESVRKEGSTFIAAASGSLKVVNLATGAVLYSATKSWQAIGSDETAARTAALRELGSNVFGIDLVSSLE
jgi:hypothetical protein